MQPEYMMKCLMLRSRDNARTPMQWDDSEQAGFTDGDAVDQSKLRTIKRSMRASQLG